MQRITVRTLPDGIVRKVYPYHVCVRGHETAVLCRDDADYDMMVKTICLCAYRQNVKVVIYAVVSNHCHVAVLAAFQQDADAFGEDLKKCYSMWFSRKYGASKILHRIDVKALSLDNDWHVRNALAYIPHNAIDNGSNIDEYPWSGYAAMFSAKMPTGRPVASLTKREKAAVLHTALDLSAVPWLLDADDHLIPRSFCDHLYLEEAFSNDQAFFLKTIGALNVADVRYTLEEKPYHLLPDSEFFKSAEETSLRWFNAGLSALSPEQRNRLIPYLYRTSKTTIPQLARVTGIPRDAIAHILSM